MERFLWPRTERSGTLITFTFLLESHAEQQKLLNTSLCSQQNKHQLRNIKLQVLERGREVQCAGAGRDLICPRHPIPSLYCAIKL